MPDVDSLSSFDPSSSWPREVVDATAATVRGLSSLLLIPASFCYLVISLVREAALIIRVATAPIAAAGLVNDSTKTWCWKSRRWFFSCLLIAPAAALALGIGVQLSAGVVAGGGDSTAAAAGTAVIGAVMVANGALCPLVLFRLLAFMDPGTASGAALRQSPGAVGGLSGLVSGGEQGTGSGAAAQSGGEGRAQGEFAAEAQSASRPGSMLGRVGTAMGAGTGMAASCGPPGSRHRLGRARLDRCRAPGCSPTPTDQRSSRRASGGSRPGSSGTAPGSREDGGTSGGPAAGGGVGLATPPPGVGPSGGGLATPPASLASAGGRVPGAAKAGPAGAAAAPEAAAVVAL